MNFDTLTISIPPHVVRSMKSDNFVQNDQTDMENGNLLRTYQAKTKLLPIGVSKIQMKEGADYHVTISAKTLGQNYLSGINLNNWQQAIESVSPILDIDANKLWDHNPIIHRCDTTDNVLLSDIGYTKNQICRSLYSSCMNERFIAKWYESSKKLGVEFHGTQQEKNRLIIYDKKLDLTKSANKEFCKSIPNLLKMFNEADNSLRFETNHTTYRSMRSRLQVETNNLQEVLNSKAKVNHDFLAKVLKVDFKQLSIWNEAMNYKGNGMDFVIMKGYETIIMSLNYNVKACKMFFRELLGERSFKYNWNQVKTRQTIVETIMKLKEQNQKNRGAINKDIITMNVCESVMKALKQVI